MELFTKISNGFQPLTIFAKSLILDIWQGSVYSSAAGNKTCKVYKKTLDLCMKIKQYKDSRTAIFGFTLVSFLLTLNRITTSFRS